MKKQFLKVQGTNVNTHWLRTSLFSLIIFSLLSCEQTFCGEHIENAKGPIIAFDLHGVVLSCDYMKILPTMIHFNHKWDLIKNLYKLPMRRLFPFMLAWPTFEQFVDAVGQGNDSLRDLLIDLSVQQKVIPETARLIQQLHESGYTLHVLSNIGAESCERLRRKFADVFNNFSFIMTSDPVDHKGKLVRKPDPQFFTDYLEKIKAEPGDVAFVDDRIENVEAAHSRGMHAIHFKNAQQLATELLNLGLVTAGNE